MWHHHGDAVFHAGEMFLPTSNRIAAELRGILWVLHSLCDLHFYNIEIWSDYGAPMEAISDPLDWPRIYLILIGFIGFSRILIRSYLRFHRTRYSHKRNERRSMQIIFSSWKSDVVTLALKKTSGVDFIVLY
jgi:hypothetical protein